ncbi:hypothetical protein M8J77_015650 [Diaphorina citri]|nr:hypothetical protein M8J77_015650 [Diaphorina citri]
MPPTSSAPKPERDNQQWVKLKTYILNRRNEEIQEKEKEEELAKKRKLLEEEYLKTKEELEKVQKEISDKNNLLKQFADEKHELFLQLKKVLLDDDNRKRIESEKNEHTLLLNNLNHTSQAQIYISQAPLSNNIGQQAPINSSSIYKLPMTTATAIPSPHTINNKRTRSPSPLPNSIPSQPTQIHPSYQAYKHATSGNPGNSIYASQQLKLSEEQQKHLQLSQQQQHQQQRQQQNQQGGRQVGSSGSMSHHHQQQSNNEYLQRNIMTWQQQSQIANSNTPQGKSSGGSGGYQHYFPQGQQHVPTSQYQPPRSQDNSKPSPIFLHHQQQRPTYDDNKYRIEHFTIRLPNQHGQPPPVSSSHGPPASQAKGGSITAGYPMRGIPGTRVVTGMLPMSNTSVTYHPQHKFIPHSNSGNSNNKQ